MNSVWIAVIIVVAVVILAGVAFFLVHRARSRRLQQQFGDEYGHAVEGSGSRREAERDLRDRAERREQLDIRPLDPALQAQYAQRWTTAQTEFVDDPATALVTADTLVTEVMRQRGYPTQSFDQAVRDVSVDHGSVTDRYRTAHGISVLSGRGEATTEQLREGMVHYRALFSGLLEADTAMPGENTALG